MRSESIDIAGSIALATAPVSAELLGVGVSDSNLQYAISSRCDLIAASSQALSAEAVLIFVIDRHIDAAVIDVMKRIDFFPDNIPRPLPFRFVRWNRKNRLRTLVGRERICHCLSELMLWAAPTPTPLPRP